MKTIIVDTYHKYEEFWRFCIVGAICTAIDAAIFYVVSTFASYPVALTSGYVLSLIVNYFLTVCWTFRSKPNAKNAAGVIAAHIINLFVVRMGLMYLFVDVIALKGHTILGHLLTSEQIAYIPTLAISVVTNFIIIKLVINKTR